MIEKINILDFTKGNFGKYVAVTDEGFSFNITRDEYRKLLNQSIVKEPLELEREITSISIRNHRYYVQYVEGEVEITKRKYNQIYEALSEVQAQTK